MSIVMMRSLFDHVRIYIDGRGFEYNTLASTDRYSVRFLNYVFFIFAHRGGILIFEVSLCNGAL